MSRTWPGCTGWSGGTTSSPVEMMPTTGGTATAISVMPSASSPPTSCGTQAMARRQDRLALADIFADLNDVLSFGDGLHDLDARLVDALRILDHDHGIGARGHHATGMNDGRLTDTDFDGCRLAHGHLADNAEKCR